MEILGEPLEIFLINGVNLLLYLMNKPDWKNMQEKEDGTILICSKSAMEE
jgi:hypothetical protein